MAARQTRQLPESGQVRVSQLLAKQPAQVSEQPCVCADAARRRGYKMSGVYCEL